MPLDLRTYRSPHTGEEEHLSAGLDVRARSDINGARSEVMIRLLAESDRLSPQLELQINCHDHRQ